MRPPVHTDWQPDAAAHLLRRAGFGGTPKDAEVLASAGLEGAVDRLLADDGGGLPPPPATDPAERLKRRQLFRARRAEDMMGVMEAGGHRRQAREVYDNMRTWWMERMRADGAAVREKVTLFWHGHFATSQAKVKFNHIMLGQNQTLRRLAVGPFRELCSAMVGDPAMLVWLDGRENKAKSPNENFAREVMELFTLGEGHYSENDIGEAARCFTGWTVKMDDGEAVFAQRRHDDGPKQLLGRRGNFGADEAVEILCSQPRCAEFLAGKLWEFYAYPQPEPELVASLAAHYRANDLRTGELLRAIFTRPEFYSPRARATQIKSPVQWLVQASRETGRQLLPPRLAIPLTEELGQGLFEPPSVKGWDGGAAWINSATLIRRSNTARLFAVAAAPLPVGGEGSMDAAAWAKVAPHSARTGAAALADRLEKVFLAVPPSKATRHKLDALLAGKVFPCNDETVREASIVLLGCPEYNLC